MNFKKLRTTFEQESLKQKILAILKANSGNNENKIQEAIYNSFQGMNGTWKREVNEDLKKDCTKGCRVDFTHEISGYLDSIIEVKIFQEITSKDGHIYPHITNRLRTKKQWSCLQKIKDAQVVTSSDEGQLFVDLLRMLWLKEKAGNPKTKLFEIIIIDLPDLQTNFDDILVNQLLPNVEKTQFHRKYRVFRWKCVKKECANFYCPRCPKKRNPIKRFYTKKNEEDFIIVADKHRKTITYSENVKVLLLQYEWNNK